MARVTIPHGKLFPAHLVKSGMTIYHKPRKRFVFVELARDINGKREFIFGRGLSGSNAGYLVNQTQMIFVRINTRRRRAKTK